MRKLIFAINTTLDGCCDHTKGIADEETHEYFTDLLREVEFTYSKEHKFSTLERAEVRIRLSRLDIGSGQRNESEMVRHILM